MRTKVNLLAALILASAFVAAGQIPPVVKWDVETGKQTPTPQNLTIRRGESVNLQPRFLSYGAAISIPTNTAVEWRNGSTNTAQTYYLTNTVANYVVATDTGRVCIPFGAWCEPASDVSRYEIAISGTLIRAYGTLTMLAGVGDPGGGVWPTGQVSASAYSLLNPRLTAVESAVSGIGTGSVDSVARADNALTSNSIAPAISAATGGVVHATDSTYTATVAKAASAVQVDTGATNATLDLNGTVTTAVYDSVSRTLAISGTVAVTGGGGATNVTLMINGQIVTGSYDEATATVAIPTVGDYLRLDGGTNMNANLDMGGYSVTNAVEVLFNDADPYHMGIGQLSFYNGTMWLGYSANHGSSHIMLYTDNWDGLNDVPNVTIQKPLRVDTFGWLQEDPTPALRVGNYIQQYASFDGTDYSAHFRFNEGQHEAYVGRYTEGAYFSNSLSVVTINSVNDGRQLKIADDEVQDQYTWVSPLRFAVHGTNGEVVAIGGIVDGGSNALVRLDNSSVEHLLFDSGTIPQSAGVLVTDGFGNLSVQTVQQKWLVDSVSTNDLGEVQVVSNLYTVIDPIPAE